MRALQNTVRNGHTPFRRHCKWCLQGGARHRQHRKVLAPQAWTMSIDTAGPFPNGVDEDLGKARYLIVAVLSVPILSKEGREVDEPSDRDPKLTLEEFAESLDDKEWFLEKGMELEGSAGGANFERTEGGQGGLEQLGEDCKDE